VKTPVEVRNGTVSGCRVGVFGELDSRIVNMTIVGGEGGFNGGSCESSTATNALYSGIGLHKGASRDCHAIDNGQTGIVLYAYENDEVSLRDSTASGNGIYGVVAYSGATLRDVVSDNNADDGFVISATGSVKIKNCSASGNGRHGFRLDTSDGRVKVGASLSTDNGEDGFVLYGGDVKLIGSEASGNGGSGFSAGEYVDRGRVKGNLSQDNGVDMFDATTTCMATKWRMNSFSTANALCIQ
jgi:hypothetical protein